MKKYYAKKTETLDSKYFRNQLNAFTRDLNEGVPYAGPAAVLERHALHLVRRRRRPEHEPLREAPPAQPARPTTVVATVIVGSGAYGKQK